jgi:hypothetical protein
MLAKFVRWMGAYCPRSVSRELVNAALWEVSQADREVACEPLFRGRSLILNEQAHVHVGLVPCMDKTNFCVGYFGDALTKITDSGLLTANRNKKSVRDMDRFLAAWGKSAPKRHGECIVDFFTVKAVAVRYGAPQWAVEVAHEIAHELGVPVEVVHGS